jgi:hypothetical protein
MEFEHKHHEECYQKVVGWMKELFGEMAFIRDDSPVVAISTGSAVTQVYVSHWGDDDAIVCVRSYVTTGTEITPELMRFLLEKNTDMRFGAFGIDEDGDIIFEHTIVGSTIDKEELRASVKAVLSVSDNYDDDIVSRWGGTRALD